MSFNLRWESFAAAAKSLQSCPTLCDPIDGSPSGSPVPGILQARTQEWVAISFSNAWKWKVKVKLLSHIWLLATPWTAPYQTPPSMGFSRLQEYWSGVPLPSPESLLGSIYMGIVFIHSTALCLLIGAFNPSTLLVVIDRCVLIGILLIVCCCFYSSFCFFISSLPLWFDNHL